VEGGSDDDLCVDEFLVKSGVLALLVGGGHKGVASILEPLADAELVLSGTEQSRLLLGVLTTLGSVSDCCRIAGAKHLRRKEPKEPCPVDWQ
jgi:hypothetical protein